MTHTVFARRRRKVSVLRQQVEQLKPILTIMNNATRNWKTTTMGVLIILGYVINAALTFLQTGALPSIEAASLAIGSGLGFIFAKDGDKTGIVRLLILAPACLMLCSCENGKFMGLSGDQWGNVAMTTGKELGKQLPATALQAYTAEKLKPSGKQPVAAVNPAESNQAPLLLPPLEASPSRSWLSSLFN